MTTMRVHAYERFWMWSALAIIVFFLALTIFAAVSQGRLPPSHVETIDPQTVFSDPRFAQPGLSTNADGGVTVTIVALTFAFVPNEIRLPVNVPVTFRLTSIDVVHGFQIVGTNGNTMVVPGYVSQFTMTFDTPGEYLVTCNEFCGLGHHGMFATIIVEDGGTP